MPFYLELARTRPVYLYRHDADTWTDMGKLSPMQIEVSRYGVDRAIERAD